MKIVKRDGRYVEFDKTKIENAIIKAFKEVDDGVSEDAKRIASETAGYIEGVAEEHSGLSVEDIQNIVEEKLMESDRKDVAKTYVIYRNDRNRVREMNSELMRTIQKKLDASDVQNQNANVDEKSFGGRMGEATSAMMKQYALDNLISAMARKNHLNNEVYIHDLDHYAVGDHNCLSLPLDDLLANGFNTRQTDVRPAQSVNTAFQLVAVLFQLQSLQQFGGVSATHLDWTMIPYVRKSFWKHYKDGLKYIEKVNNPVWFESNGGKLPICANEYHEYENAYTYATDMTTKEVYQAVEGMYHNLNTLQSRSGNQLNTKWLAA